MSNTDTLAVNGGTPVRDNQQKSWTRWPPNEEDEWEKTIEPALREVFLSRTEGLPAPNGLGFGEAFAEYCNAKYGIIPILGQRMTRLNIDLRKAKARMH